MKKARPQRCPCIILPLVSLGAVVLLSLFSRSYSFQVQPVFGHKSHLLPRSSDTRSVSLFEGPSSNNGNIKTETLGLSSNDPAPLLTFTDTVFDEIAERLQEHFADIPFAPAPLVTYCLKQVLENMSHDLSAETLGKINEVILAEETKTEYDDVSSAELLDLADHVAKELCDSNAEKNVHIPMITPEQEFEILKQIVRVVLDVLTSSEDQRRTAWVSSNLASGRDLLTSPERRKKLAKTINKVVDIPLLSEGQEETMLEAAIEQCAATLEHLIPPDLLETLKGESPQGLAEMKESLIVTVNEKVDLIGFSEEQEAELIRSMIQLLIDEYANDIETEMLLLTEVEQQERLQEKITELEWELTASRARFQREQDNLQAQLDRLKTQLNETG